MRFDVARIDDDDAAALVVALLADLRDRYGVEDLDEPAPVDLMPPGGVFLVARTDDGPVGCGGIRYHVEGIAELKRMYVVPEAIALYESAGYRPIDRYGHDHSSLLSRCFEKDLDVALRGQGTS